MSFSHKHILGTRHLSPQDITLILDTAEQEGAPNRSIRPEATTLALS